MLLRVINIVQLPTSIILSCETEDTIPDRIAGDYELRDKTGVRQIVKIEGRVAVRQLTGDPTSSVDIFTHDAVKLTQEEAFSSAFSLAPVKVAAKAKKAEPAA